MTRWSLIALACVLAGCPKDDAPKPAASSSPTTASASASAPPSASAAPSTDAATSGGATAASYEGKYTATPGVLYIPSENKEYTGVKQAKDDGSKMVGDGTFTLAVDGSGRVSGTIDSGPAQGALIVGTVEGGNVSALVRVKSPGEDGLHGTLFGKMGDDAIEGTMKLADSNASTLRDVKFTASKKK